MSTIALFGGTFDPPHIGHVEVVLSVLDQHLADEVWVVPVRQNPLKDRRASPPKVRRAMVEAAFGKLPKTRILYDELEKESPIYTIDTIRALKKKYPALLEAKLFFVVGSEAFCHRNQWKEIDELEKELTFLVVPREDVRCTPSSNAKMLPVMRLDVSSTLIRERVLHGKYVKHLMDATTEQLIHANGLYDS